jgi:hypothetical protein
MKKLLLALVAAGLAFGFAATPVDAQSLCVDVEIVVADQTLVDQAGCLPPDGAPTPPGLPELPAPPDVPVPDLPAPPDLPVPIPVP